MCSCHQGRLSKKSGYWLNNSNVEEALLVNLPLIEEVLNATTSVLKSSAEQSIPKVKFKHHLKPFWKQGLKSFHEKSRYCRKLWIQQGRPRDPENSFFKDYKQAKRSLEES